MMKNTKTTYRIINLSDDKVLSYRNPEEAALYLLTRPGRTYVVLKTDDLGSRMVPISYASVQDCVDALLERIG